VPCPSAIALTTKDCVRPGATSATSSRAGDLVFKEANPAVPVRGPTRKLGSDNGDAIYLQVWIDGPWGRTRR